MGGSERVLYPMLGVGAFFAAFWAGIVIGYELGFSCFGLLLHGFGFALLGAMLVAKLERHDTVNRLAQGSESMQSRSRCSRVQPSNTLPRGRAARSRAGGPGAGDRAVVRDTIPRPA